jgi:hypothetical protein
MKEFFTRLFAALAALTRRKTGAEKPLPPQKCEFCGETTHRTADCPNAAKFKLFNVDRE